MSSPFEPSTAGADTASELGRRLSVSKQAAAKTIAALQKLGYVDREVDPNDGRRKRLRVTPRGYEMIAIGGALFDDVRERWAAQIGVRQLSALEAHLGQLVGLQADPWDTLRPSETAKE